MHHLVQSCQLVGSGWEKRPTTYREDKNRTCLSRISSVPNTEDVASNWVLLLWADSGPVRLATLSRASFSNRLSSPGVHIRFATLSAPLRMTKSRKRERDRMSMPSPESMASYGWCCLTVPGRKEQLFTGGGGQETDEKARRVAIMVKIPCSWNSTHDGPREPTLFRISLLLFCLDTHSSGYTYPYPSYISGGNPSESR